MESVKENLVPVIPKGSVKGLTLPSSLHDKVGLLCKIKFGGLAESELKSLCILIEYSTNNQLAITAEAARQIKQHIGLTDSAFSTSLHRLEKKGIITRSGKTVIITPLFKDVILLDKLIISFV